MTNNNSDEKRTLNLPKNINLPFFTYGIFKPGQLAYSKIKNHVLDYTNVEINYEMKHRDGVPILIDGEKDYYHTKGSIITFKENNEKIAYHIICKTELKKLYEWKTIKINGYDVNVLFGLNPDNGSNPIENPEERISFDGKKDPLFFDAIKFIEENLNSNEFSWEMGSFFELQMNYMLLWSAIERYTSIKYNEFLQKDNNKRLAKENAFKEGINKFKDKKHDPVYSTDDAEIHEFNVEDPYETLKYFYTFRCNVVHKGKSQPGDYKKLKTATEELLEIFKNVLNNAFIN